MEAISIIVAGACGRMGSQTVRAVEAEPGMRLAGAVDCVRMGEDVGVIACGAPNGVPVVSTLGEAVAREKADVLIDFTRGDAAAAILAEAIDRRISCVTGTTGIPADDLEMLKKKAAEQRCGLIIAPNFALGAVLMMDFARRAAKYFEYAEILELHHENKLDAPSGTALRTAELMIGERPSFIDVPAQKEKIPHTRGGLMGGIRIHAVRLPGLLAHQEVMLGRSGELLTLRHDSTSRESFMPGVIMAARKSLDLKGPVVGLENILD
jgi:4-hydroxy-tetrahydrodipicolinate reductase